MAPRVLSEGPTPSASPKAKPAPVVQPDRYASTPNLPVGQATMPQVTEEYTPWNADTSKVYLGQRPTSSYSGGIPGPEVPRETNVYEVSTTWLTSLKANDPQSFQNLKDQLRAGGFLGPRSNAYSAVKDALQQAAKEAAARIEAGQSTGIDVLDYIRSTAGSGSGSGSGSRKSGNANLPRVSQTPDEDIIRMANDQAMSLVGRELSKKELSAILKDVRGLEAANPQEQRVVGGRIVYSGGVSSATLQDLVQNRAAEIATKGLNAAAPLQAGAAKTADELRNWSRDNGVGLSDAALSRYTQRILRGETNVDDVKSEPVSYTHLTLPTTSRV